MHFDVWQLPVNSLRLQQDTLMNTQTHKADEDTAAEILMWKQRSGGAAGARVSALCLWRTQSCSTSAYDQSCQSYFEQDGLIWTRLVILQAQVQSVLCVNHWSWSAGDISVFHAGWVKQQVCPGQVCCLCFDNIGPETLCKQQLFTGG